MEVAVRMDQMSQHGLLLGRSRKGNRHYYKDVFERSVVLL